MSTWELLPTAYVVTAAGVLGLLIGSFLNVVVHRVPAGLSVVSPPSACPGCDHEIRARDNLPVVSWLLLRGRCRDCAITIPVRYPLVEAVTGAAFAFTAWRLSDPVLLGAALVVVAAGIALALIDLEHGRLPFAITGAAAALVAVVLVAGLVAGASIDLPVVALSVAIWFALYGGIWLLTAGRGMGLGDVALAPLLGVVLGLWGLGPSLVGLMAGFAVGAVVVVGLMSIGRLQRGQAVPHGPFMLVGAAIGLFAGDPIAATYLRTVGLV
ncbi:prepilin peptidase [Nocardioides sp.]|uniref:prepilin peptidase n=1 Tax=Nocardioides sp. TaxID=35761 RepID=UPI002B266F61|nr:prepilin peptidase [Nocardioides sp.]